MNMKNKIVAILMASIVAMAIVAPMAFAGETDNVSTSAMVTGVAPTTVWQSVDPDADADPANGIQIEPVQDANKNVKKCILVHHPNGAVTVKDIEVHINTSADVILDTETLSNLTAVPSATPDPACWAALNAQNSALYTTAKANPVAYTMYTGTWVMGPCVPAGDGYKIQCRAYNGTTWSDWRVDTFEILSMMGIDLDLDAVSFESVAPGTSKEVTGDDAFGGTLLTVKSTNNAAIDVQAEVKTPMTDGTNTISDANIGCRVNVTAYKALDSAQTYDVNLGCGDTEKVDLKLTVDPGQPAGNYNGALTFTAVVAA